MYIINREGVLGAGPVGNTQSTWAKDKHKDSWHARSKATDRQRILKGMFLELTPFYFIFSFWQPWTMDWTVDWTMDWAFLTISWSALLRDALW